MTKLAWTLFFIYLSFKAQTADTHPDWTIDVPHTVKGLSGSCVVIPCSFKYPNEEKAGTHTGMWMYKTNQYIYHSHKSKILEEYRNRTTLLGDLREKKCSLKIDPLLQRDQGPFYFRIEITNVNKYTYVNNKVSIEMINETNPIHLSVQEIKDGQNASCAVSHSCPTSPPVFTWSHFGKIHVQSQQLQNGQWKATSTLTFHPTSADRNKPLQCTVRYKGGQQHKKAEVLNITYAPEVKNISSCSLKACVCVVESMPPSMVHFVLPDRVLPSTKLETNGTFTTGTLQAELEAYDFVVCVANNTKGSINITLFLPGHSGMKSVHIIIIVATGAVVLLVILLVAVAVVKKGMWFRRAPAPCIKLDKGVRPHQDAATNRNENSYSKQDFHDSHIYSNENVYGNTGTDWDDAIYANVGHY